METWLFSLRLKNNALQKGQPCYSAHRDSRIPGTRALHCRLLIPPPPLPLWTRTHKGRSFRSHDPFEVSLRMSCRRALNSPLLEAGPKLATSLLPLCGDTIAVATVRDGNQAQGRAPTCRCRPRRSAWLAPETASCCRPLSAEMTLDLCLPEVPTSCCWLPWASRLPCLLGPTLTSSTPIATNCPKHWHFLGTCVLELDSLCCDDPSPSLVRV